MPPTPMNSATLTYPLPPPKASKILAALDRLPPTTSGPLEQPQARKVIGLLPQHCFSYALLWEMSQALADIQVELHKRGVVLGPRVETAVSDLVTALGEVPDILSGRASLKVDAPEGCFTIERGIRGPWLVYARLNTANRGCRRLGHEGCVLQVTPWLKAWSVEPHEFPEAIEAVQRIMLSPGAIIRGSAIE